MLSLRIAGRYLFSRKSHAAVNIITMISAAGIVVASAAMIVIMSVFNGFGALAESNLTSLESDLLVERRDGAVFGDADSLSAEIARVAGVGCVASPVMRTRAFAVSDGLMAIRLKGVTDSGLQSSSLDKKMVRGSYETQREGWDCALLSPGVATGLGRTEGDYSEVMLYAPRRGGRVNPGNPASAFVRDTVLVAGIFVTENAETDADLVVTDIAVPRRLGGYDSDAADGIEVYGDAVDAASVMKVLPGGRQEWRVSDRVGQHQEASRMVAVEKWMTFMLLGFVLIIASFNVISTMSLLVVEKEGNVAVLTAMGATDRLMRRVYRLTGWMITVGGGIVGVLLGVCLCLAQQWGGFVKMQVSDPTVLSVTVYPVAVEWSDVPAVLAIVVLTGVVTGMSVRRVRKV